MTSIERTAYPRFKRLVSAHELHLFFAPTREEAAWAAERMDADGDQLALLLALRSYQRMGRFPRPEEYPEAVVDFVRRAVELPEATPIMAGGRTAVRKRRVVHSSTLDGLGLLSQTRVQSRRLSSRRGGGLVCLPGIGSPSTGLVGDEPILEGSCERFRCTKWAVPRCCRRSMWTSRGRVRARRSWRSPHPGSTSSTSTTARAGTASRCPSPGR
ncbi:DUF4158 domain-containing protein [Streptomyces sp. MS1.HAVA.3]|uniref:DUF4158 domain-containing protein n=1 Tax=Streptomyces caledonius TaxID=3134107 RepID=A0ABU8U1F8_9ACTN